MYQGKDLKAFTGFSVSVLALAVFGCAKGEPQTQLQHSSQESETDLWKTEAIHEENVETGSKTEVSAELEANSETKTNLESAMNAETESMMDLYGPVDVSELDYDSFQSRMTDEEWEGFQQYFPVLKENAEFHYADFGEELNKDKEHLKGGEYYLYSRYTSKEIWNIRRYVEAYSEGNDVEWKVEDVRVFDLDGDGVQELILQWTPVGELLVLHRENDEFYGWAICYRGFEGLQTNGIYISSGGAGSNRWKKIRFEDGSWLEETLFEEDWGKFYANGEPTDEDTFLQLEDASETEEVTRYEPMRRMAGVVKVRRDSEDGVMKTYYELADGLWECEDTVYPIRLELRGRMPNAVKDSVYVVLTNNAALTFEEVSKSLFSSSFEDTKIMEGSVLVELR